MSISSIANLGQEAHGFAEHLSKKDWLLIFVVILGPFMVQLDATIVNVALATIQKDLHASMDSAQWIISGYLLAATLVLPLNNWLVDRIGIKKLYVWSFAAFTLASVLCGLARTMDELILARVLQGVAGGCFSPLTQIMMARIAGKQMVRVMGYAAIPILLAPLFGPAMAGAILNFAHWPWLFYVNLPVGIVAVTFAALLIPKEQESFEKRNFDWPGFLMISPGLAFLLYGFERATHGGGYWFLVSGFVSICSFVVHAKKKKTRALIDVEIFRIRTFSIATITLFLINGMTYMGQLIIPLYLISGCGMSTSTVGLILGANGIGMLCIYPMMGRLVDRFGCRPVVSGGVVVALVTTLPFFFMTKSDVSITLTLLCLFLRGMGHGATAIPSVAAAFASVPKEKFSLASTASNIVQRLGGPVMTTLFSFVIAMSAMHTAENQPQAFTIPFMALMMFQLLVLASALQLPLRVYPATK